MLNKLTRGTTLTELMISLVLVHLILMGLITAFMAAKRQFKLQSIEMEQAFDVQLISEILGDSIRSSGFTPCLNLNLLDTHSRSHQKIPALARDPDGGLHLYKMSLQFEEVEVLENQKVYVKSTPFKKGKLVLIADCQHAEVQEIQSIQQNKAITLSSSLCFKYQKPIFIGEFVEERFHLSAKDPNMLMYQVNGTEEILSSFLHPMTWTLTTHKGHNYVRLTFGLPHDKATIDVRTRS